ncbi:tumor necrosis factor receptor superfamily member 27 [Esox lucius]|uniref:TNFR-Cys domain-containing protein n=1 Tax=Esox lucius TaxID=8010 RepID=A0A3P8Y0U1_ESOLU|nr:tumor necrosis factor receptor superfamily member 27 [Esox lucius]
MDCSENQYYLNGVCHPCLKCGPGKELSEDCGYGSGWSAYCIPCSVKTYKESRNSHNCKFCQSCKHINRHQKSPCTSKKNAVCGECLPGFYSKTRMDGLQDLECIPCGFFSTSEHECSRSRAIDVENVSSPEAPAQNVAVTTISVALVTMAIILFTALFIYFRHSLLKKVFKGCLALQTKSQSDMECAASPLKGVTLNLEKQGQDSGTCDNSSTADKLARLKSNVEVAVPPGSILHYPDFKTQGHSYLPETQPLVCNSACSNCSSGFVSWISTELPSMSSNMPFIVETLVGPVDSVSSSAGYCASEVLESLHVPVECTELDLQITASSAQDFHNITDTRLFVISKTPDFLLYPRQVSTSLEMGQ